ncbi:MAG TPA: RNA methyltransferase [Anaerolineae bacterium]|nr:RNA methyltransferase [Anaerolineae bacterium]
MITSPHNERVKQVRALVRRRVREREARFVVEGTRLVEELVRAGVRPALAFYTPDWLASSPGQILRPALDQAEAGAWLVSETVLEACSETESPQGVIAVAPFVQLRPRPGLILILDRLRDPGNVGTILRSAQAAGAGQVILTPETVDLYNPKVVRGAMGAHFRLPIARLGWDAVRDRAAGRAVRLADARGKVAYDAVDWVAPSALIVGGEAAGAGHEARTLAVEEIFIPMAPESESLNAAMAATVILFEAARQQRSFRP